jgi:hypothetical protein
VENAHALERMASMAAGVNLDQANEFNQNAQALLAGYASVDEAVAARKKAEREMWAQAHGGDFDDPEVVARIEAFQRSVKLEALRAQEAAQRAAVDKVKRKGRRRGR